MVADIRAWYKRNMRGFKVGPAAADAAAIRMGGEAAAARIARRPPAGSHGDASHTAFEVRATQVRSRLGGLVSLLAIVLVGLSTAGCEAPWSSWPTEPKAGGSQVRRDPETGRWVFVVPRPGLEGNSEAFGPFPAGYVYRVEYLLTSEPESRFVLETNEEGPDGETVCVVRVIDPGRPATEMKEYRLPGACGDSLVDEDRCQKALMTTLEESRRILLIDYATGEKLGEATIPVPAQQSVVHVQLLSGRWVVAVDLPPDAFQVVVVAPDGQVLKTLTLPGRFIRAVDDGSDVKVFETSRADATFDELINVRLLASVEPAVGLVPGVPLPGSPYDLQYHRVEGQDRFVQVSTLPNGSPPSTTARIFDGTGRKVTQLVFRGLAKQAVDMNPYKVLILDHSPDASDPEIDFFIVDLRTGALTGTPSPRTLHGRLESAAANDAKTGVDVTVVEGTSESTMSIPVP